MYFRIKELTDSRSLVWTNSAHFKRWKSRQKLKLAYRPCDPNHPGFCHFDPSLPVAASPSQESLQRTKKYQMQFTDSQSQFFFFYNFSWIYSFPYIFPKIPGLIHGLGVSISECWHVWNSDRAGKLCWLATWWKIDRIFCRASGAFPAIRVCQTPNLQN